MTVYQRPLARIALALVGLNLGIAASYLQGESAIAAITPYGAGQCLSAEQIMRAQHLAFPQSYGAITSALGSPEAMDRRYDWFCLPNSRQYLVIEYDRNGLAIAQGWSR